MATPQETARLEAGIDKLTFGAGSHEPPPAGHPLAFKRIVAAVDDAPASKHVIAWTQELALFFRSEVLVAHVLPSLRELAPYDAAFGWQGLGGWPGAAAVLKEVDARGRSVVDRAVADCARRGVRAEGVVLTGGSAVDEISKLADGKSADLVVLGTNARGLAGRLLLGSVSDGVKNHVQASVLVAKSAPHPSRILLATDGSRLSKRAAAIGVRLAREWKAWPTLLHVLPPAVYGPDFKIDKDEVKRDFGTLDLFEGELSVEYDLWSGAPAAAILKAANEGDYGLVVMGCRGLSGLRSLVAGSVSNRVAHEANASVLLVKDVPA